MKISAAHHEPDSSDAIAIYHTLMDAAAKPGFDTHVMAAILALSYENAREKDISLSEAAGYQSMTALEQIFPTEAWWLAGEIRGPLKRSEDEATLADLLWRGATRHDAYEAELSRMVARRAQYPNHLWQDLGLNNRGELSQLLQTHFTALAVRNVHDMKWKKFFYRTMCRDADFTLCTAPSCSECADFDTCFGDENGMSLLAKTRLKADLKK